MIILLIILFAFNNLQSQEVRVELTRTADWCQPSGTNNRMQAAVYVGPVSNSDMVYGIECAIKYDTSKIVIRNFLYGTNNTLFFQFQHKNIVDNYENGVIVADAAQISVNQNVFGNQPLFAFNFDYKEDIDCNEDIDFEIDYIYFTNQDVQPILKYNDLKSERFIFNLQKNQLSDISLFVDNYELTDTLEYEIPFLITQSGYDKLSKLRIEVEMNNTDDFELLSVDYDKSTLQLLTETGTTGFKIFEFEKISEFLNTAVTAKVKSLTSGKHQTGLSLTIIPLDDCHCISGNTGLTSILVSNIIDSIPNSVNEQIQNKFYFENKQLTMTNPNDSFSIYNIQGNIVATKQKSYYNFNNMPLGVYLIVMYDEFGNVETKKITNH